VAENIQLQSIPKVEVVDQNGKSLDTSAIDNYDAFMASLFQASIAANTAKIRKLEEDRQSKGKILNLPLNITQNEDEIRCPYPCQSLFVENNGPGQIFISINSPEESPTPIPATRQAIFPFDNHAIERFYVSSAAGTVATATAILKA